MSAHYSGNYTHDTTAAKAEATRQSAYTASSAQSTVRTAEIAFYRSCRASAIANGLSPSSFIFALQELGTGGV